MVFFRVAVIALAFMPGWKAHHHNHEGRSRSFTLRLRSDIELGDLFEPTDGRVLGVMLALVPNVGDHPWKVLRTKADDPISSLPLEQLIASAGLLIDIV